ncbi:MAG: gamma-glutamyl-gamma-aminobutyrate hydrolase family protein [Planctomycetota bacterium]|nr:MAG: gamma-glutamyl-gamma-aminobutyrate hydrolase family protein [Planctomycetota bacterium]
MPQNRRAPLIGVSMELLEPPLYSGRRRYHLDAAYLQCLRQAGATPLLLPPDAAAAESEAWMQFLDGLLLTGGDDVDLRALGGPAPAPECKLLPPAKQALDFHLVEQALARELPVLGICLGMQVFSLSHQSRYIQHLSNAADHEKGVEHPVAPVAGTRLASLVGTAAFPVASFHHQAVAAPGAGLVGTAFSPDGVLEAVERPDQTFALGVQWHPERQPQAPSTRALFSGFVAAAGAYRGSRV